MILQLQPNKLFLLRDAPASCVDFVHEGIFKACCRTHLLFGLLSLPMLRLILAPSSGFLEALDDG